MRKPANEYAKEIFDGFLRELLLSTPVYITIEEEEEWKPFLKECSLRCIEELTNNIPWEDKKQSAEDYQYYQAVKNEINLLK